MNQSGRTFPTTLRSSHEHSAIVESTPPAQEAGLEANSEDSPDGFRRARRLFDAAFALYPKASFWQSAANMRYKLEEYAVAAEMFARLEAVAADYDGADSPPPGLDEAIAIAKVLQFTKDEKFSKFTRIVFDTAPTGHTLRLLSLPEFLDKSIGKIVRLRQKLTSAGDCLLYTSPSPRDRG